MVEIASLVLFASDLGAAAAFYRAVGVPLVDEDHDDGPVHAAAELGGVHFAIYQAEAGVGIQALGWRSAASDFPGFYVDSLDDVSASLSALGAHLLEPHQARPWGCRVVAEDPDGRAVEINQREHCSSRQH
jgi:lactoylglutathione lyase